MSTDLSDSLRELAARARTPRWDADALWLDAHRRRRRRQALRAVAAAAALVVVAGLAWQLLPRGERGGPVPADTSFSDLHLPRTIYPPDPWSAGNADVGPPGPLAAIWLADRERLEGLDSVEYQSWFGVSAVDGSSRFLDLETDGNSAGPTIGVVALSPDGRQVGYTRYRRGPGGREQLVGWSVYDTATGEVLALRADRVFDITRRTILGDTDLAFSADSRFLLVHASARAKHGGQQLVAWDVETGDPHVVEQTDAYWQPQIGPAPSGVLWSRNHTAYLWNPATDQVTEREEPRWINAPSYGPGLEHFAYLGDEGPGAASAATWRLYIATGDQPAREIPLDFEPRTIEGWADVDRVVVGDYAGRYAVVDVVTGAVTEERIDGSHGEHLLASDLWANELVDGVRPPDVMPATVRMWLIAGAVGLGLVGLGLVAWVRGRRRVG